MLTLEQKELVWRHPICREVVKLVGYQGLPSDTFHEKIQPLVEQHTFEKFWTFANKVLITDYSNQPFLYRIKSDLRSCLWVILGPDPDQPQWWAKESRQEQLSPPFAKVPSESVKATLAASEGTQPSPPVPAKAKMPKRENAKKKS